MVGWIAALSTLLLAVVALVLVRVMRRVQRAERALAHVRFELGQARRMEKVGRLAAGVAHDVSNLLVPVIACSELLMARGVGDSHLRELLPIHQAGLRARDLVRRLLVHGHQELRTQAIDPAQMLTSLQLFLERFVSAGIQLVVRIDPNTPALLGDPAQIERVIINLVSNAVQALAETQADGGRISLRLGFERLDAVRAGLLNVSEGGYVRISVEDNGPGMDEQVQARIFEAFYSTRRSAGGTGLGLASVRDVIEQHGGGIALVSQPRHGSRFDVYVPAAELGAVATWSNQSFR